MTALAELTPTPDVQLARAKYRRHAGAYDFHSLAAMPLREAAVALIGDLTGGVVVDVGCGTGLNFAGIQSRIGRSGRLVGVDPCPEMLDRARERVARNGWTNVSLVHSRADRAALPAEADVALFSLVHDVMRSPVALRHVLGCLRPGGRVIAAGAKLVTARGWWAPLLDALVLTVNEPYVTSTEGLDRPWSHLAGLVPDLSVFPGPWDVTYVAYGTVSADLSAVPADHPTIQP